MEQLNFETMQKMQQDLQEKNKDKWGGLPPEQARQKLLWMYGEMGEAGDIMKKCGDEKMILSIMVGTYITKILVPMLLYPKLHNIAYV